MIRALICVTFWVIYIAVVGSIGIVIALITRDARFLWHAGMICARGGLWLAGVRFRAQGLENLDPKAAYLFMSNHAGTADPCLMVPFIYRPMTVLSKKEMMAIPVVGTVFRLGKFIPIDRKNREAAIASIHHAAEVLRGGGISMVTYPEGTRSRDGRLLPFKKGVFHLAMEAGVPIAPATMVGTFECWPKGRFAIKPMTVTAVFHPPIDPKQFTSLEALMQAVRESIESALPEKYRDNRG